VKRYYDARAPEYDEWYAGVGVFAKRERRGWDEAVARLLDDLAALPPARTLDVACGTGFLTCRLRGTVTGLDQSARMLQVARERLPRAELVRGDALALPFGDGAFERVFTAHFYGHLQDDERRRFLNEAFRVGRELVVVDSASRPDHAAAEWQTRELNDGSRFRVFKRYFDAEQLLEELGGDGRVVHRSEWFVGVQLPHASAVPAQLDL
jgi:ubiquinone/menaquinone biosynthesis C-methylase UbiE